MVFNLKIASYHAPSNVLVTIPFPSSPITGLDLFEKLAPQQWPPRLFNFAVPNEPLEDRENWWENAHQKTLEKGGIEKWCRIYSEDDLIDFSSQVSNGIKVINAFGIYRGECKIRNMIEASTDISSFRLLSCKCCVQILEPNHSNPCSPVFQT